MSEKALEILKEIYLSINKGEDYYTIKTPPSSQIHNFNMALKELTPYIAFAQRNITTIKLTLTEEGLDYCLNNFDI